MNVKNVKTGQLKKGMILAKPGSFTPTNHFDGTVYFLTRAEGGRARPIMNKYMQMIYVDTWNMVFRLDFLDSGTTMIMPGEQATVRFTLPSDMPMIEGQQFTLRENQMTVGTGRITKLFEPVYVPKKAKLAKQVISLESKAQ